MEMLEFKFKHAVEFVDEDLQLAAIESQQKGFNVEAPLKNKSDPLCFLFQIDKQPVVYPVIQASQSRVRPTLPLLKQHFIVQQVTRLSSENPAYSVLTDIALFEAEKIQGNILQDLAGEKERHNYEI